MFHQCGNVDSPSIQVIDEHIFKDFQAALEDGLS